MPATNALGPMCNPAEREILKSYGDWTNFCHVHGLKPYDMEQNEEATQILRSMARAEARSQPRSNSANARNNNNNNNNGGRRRN